MTTEYNWSEIHDTALKIAPSCTRGYTELAEALGMPRRTLRDGLAREFNLSGFPALLAECDSEGSIGVLQQKVDHWKRLAKRYEKQLTNRQWLKEELAGLIATRKPVPVPSIKFSRKKDYQEQVAVLEFSDGHDGLSVPQGQLGALGTYSSQICEARSLYIYKTFAHLVKQMPFPVRKVKVYKLGDNVENSHMRPGQAAQVDAHVVKQTLHMSDIMATGVQFLCGEFEEVEVDCVPGNHGRNTQKYGENLPDETYDHLAYHLMARSLKDQKNLKINIHPTWYFVDNVFGYKLLGLHCEDVLSYMGVPFYGIERAVKDYYMMLGQSSIADLRELPPETQFTVEAFLEKLLMPDYVCIGHFHNPMIWAIMGVEVIANGTLSGVSIFGTKRLRKLTPPSQQMFFIHPDHGVSWRLPIKLASVK